MGESHGRVRVERRDAVLVIQIDRPEKRNALNSAIAHGLEEAIDRLEGDSSLAAGVLTGGADVFSSGADFRAAAQENLATARGGQFGLVRRSRTKVLIAAVEGPALGGGFELVLSCDLVVASTSATFGLPEATRGVFAGSGGAFRAARVLPLNVARELLVTGRRLDACRAERLGLVNILSEPGMALVEAIALAAEVARNSPAAVTEGLRLLREVGVGDETSAWAASDRARAAVWAGGDPREGPRAFLQKRAPVWKSTWPGEATAR